MLYGDIQFFDLIVFAGIAVFLIYRLRNVLGKRAGFQKKTSIQDRKKEKQEENKNTPQLKENELKFQLAYETLNNFDHKAFLEGAKFAFETIINAFNKGDKKTLKDLLTKEVCLSFEQAIEAGNTNPGFQFYSLVVNGVEDVFVEDKKISIVLKITSEQFKDNDENTIVKKQDSWTFQKIIKDDSPIWLLSST